MSTPKRRRVTAIYNPAAGNRKGGRFKRTVAAMRDLGADVTILETTHPGHAEDLARALDPSETDVVTACGGDGTVNEVVNGLAGRDIPLALIPLGTANVLADEVRLSRKPRIIADIIVNGDIRPIRVGRANGRCFVMMAGTGFDASVVQNVDLPLKRIIGPLAYVWQMIVEIFTYPYDRVIVDVDGVQQEAVSAIVCNGRSYGGPFIVAPEADLADGAFTVILFTRRGWFNVARYGLALLFGRLPYLEDVVLTSGQRITITGVDDAPVQGDGDILTQLPAAIEFEELPLGLAAP